MSKIKVSSKLDNPLTDKRINTNSWMTTMRIGDYLNLSDKDGNIYQRDLQRLSFYQKLIDDLLHDGIMPPISVVYTGDIKDIQDGFLEEESSFLILDGLQRTNCLQHCKKEIEGNNRNSIFNNVEEFLKKEIYVEIWGGMSLQNILYKMIVLNTGQKKMDYNHQLNILSDSVRSRLIEDEVPFISSKERKNGSVYKKDNALQLSTITEGLASFINGSPLQSKKNAAEFLFNRFDGSFEKNKAGLDLVSDEKTYETLKWVLTDFNDALTEKYGSNNPMVKYDVFFISLLAALGKVYNLNLDEYSTKHYDIDKRKENLLKLVTSNGSDPLNLEDFEKFYGSFKTGIGARKRKFIFEAFKQYFMTDYTFNMEWGEAYDLVS